MNIKNAKKGQFVFFGSTSLADIDFAFAKAKLALDMDAYEPIINNNYSSSIFATIGVWTGKVLSTPTPEEILRTV